MVLCTGRTRSDVPAQASFKARSDTQPWTMCWWVFNLFRAIHSCGMSNMGWGPTGGVCLCLTSRALPGLAFQKDRCCPQSSAHAGQHPLSLSNRCCSWDEAAGLHRRQPHPSQPAQLSPYPWFSSRCAVLRSQLHQANRLAPRALRSSFWAVSTKLSCATAGLIITSIKSQSSLSF